MSEPTARSLVPPRPNLGPEPWSENESLTRTWLVVPAVLALILAFFAWRALRVRRLRSPRAPVPVAPLDESPRGRLVALSSTAKLALASRFGPAWRAKTTQELAIEPALAELLGPDLLSELIAFLDRIDRLKFAPHRPSPSLSLAEELADWNPRVAGLVGKITAKPNGRPDKQPHRVRSATPSKTR